MASLSLERCLGWVKKNLNMTRKGNLFPLPARLPSFLPSPLISSHVEGVTLRTDCLITSAAAAMSPVAAAAVAKKCVYTGGNSLPVHTICHDLARGRRRPKGWRLTESLHYSSSAHVACRLYSTATQVVSKLNEVYVLNFRIFITPFSSQLHFTDQLLSKFGHSLTPSLPLSFKACSLNSCNCHLTAV